jgi:hypothetical protein
LFPAIRKIKGLEKIPYEDSYYHKINFLIDFIVDNVDLKFVPPLRLHLAPSHIRDHKNKGGGGGIQFKVEQDTIPAEEE